jgi:hypothetical protein
MAQYKCERLSCPSNKTSGWCFDIDGIHLKIFPVQFKAWSIAINNGEADLNQPPSNVLKSLMPAKAGDVNPLRKKDKTPPPVQPASMQTLSASMTPPSIMPYSMSAYPFFNPFMQAMQNFLSTTPFPQQPVASSHNEASDTNILSSPSSELDPVDRLTSYTKWLIKRSPSQSAMLSAAGDMLVNAGHNFNTIGKVSDEQYAAMKIPDGIAMQFRMDINRFKKAEAAGRL